MSLLIKPITDQLITVLQTIPENILGDLDKFRFVGSGWNGLLINPPSAWVLPMRTQFPGQGEGTGRNQQHSLTIRLGIQGTDPEELTQRVMAYVRAVDLAIAASTEANAWPDYVLYVFVSMHDYGPIFSRGGQLAYWPDLHVTVDVEEIA